MRYIAITDIHGELAKLENVLQKFPTKALGLGELGLQLFFRVVVRVVGVVSVVDGLCHMDILLPCLPIVHSDVLLAGGADVWLPLRIGHEFQHDHGNRSRRNLPGNGAAD